MVVAGVAGYGVTRGHDSTPEPVAPLKYGQQLKLTDAVPAGAVPGFRELRYAVPPSDQKPGIDGRNDSACPTRRSPCTATSTHRDG